MNKYLPSKKFLYFSSSLLVVAIVFFIAFRLFSNKGSFSTNKEEKLLVKSSTIDELIQRDSDGDSVLDWEEALWHTDPQKKSTFEGINDADYIKSKRSELKIDDTTSDKSGKETETERFAKDLFATYSAMKTSGQVDDATLSNFFSALGQEVTDPSIVNQYTLDDIKISENNEDSDQEDYYIATGLLFEKYKNDGVGSELETTEIMASTGKASSEENKLVKISAAYKKFAKEMLSVETPSSLAQYHIQIINNANNTGIAVLNMSKIISDPIVGIEGISQYGKYSEDLITSVKSLESFLSIDAIITE
jgi:hypothetical protein